MTHNADVKMADLTERERDAAKNLYKRLATALNEWRKEYRYIDDAREDLSISACGVGITLQWWIEAHYPDPQEALNELDYQYKVWRLVFDPNSGIGGRKS